MSLKLTATVNNAEKHQNDITSMIFKNNKIYSAADDGKIKMWSTDLKLEKEVQAHERSVYSLAADNSGLIYSCSSDGSIRSWKTETLEDAGVIQSPEENEMWKIYWADDTLLVVDDQGLVTLRKHGKKMSTVIMMEQIKDMAYKDNYLFTVRDIDVVVTEILPGKLGNYTCHQTFSGRAPLCIIGDKLCYSSRDGRGIFIHDRKDHKFSQIANIEHAHDLTMNALNGGYNGDECLLFSGGWDKCVKQWRLLSDGATAVSTCALEGYVNCICVGDKCKTVFAGGAEGKIWKMEN